MRRSINPISRGFTLLETMVVLTIVGLMCGIAVPRYAGSINNYKAELAARRIAADISLARAQAKMTSASQTVVFDLASSSYSLAGVSSLDHGGATYTVNLTSDPYSCQLSSVNFNGASQVTFDAYGSADQNGQIVVQCGDVQRSVLLDAASGKVTVP